MGLRCHCPGVTPPHLSQGAHLSWPPSPAPQVSRCTRWCCSRLEGCGVSPARSLKNLWQWLHWCGLTWLCTRRCCSSSEGRANALPHSAHLKGRSPVCTRSCTLSEWSHLCGRSSVCTRAWLLKSEWRLKVARHRWQVKGRASVCTTWWLSSSQVRLKLLWQAGHWKGLSATITWRISR
uniref:Uncharacterized protein n=1 Tax=Geospiza parvula TaxID=87175 RepID=A0A8U8BLJ6_GEOPR